MPEHELWEGLDLVEMYKVTITQFHHPPSPPCILSAGSATYCENEPEERGDLLLLNSWKGSFPSPTYPTFQIRSIKPRVQNVLDTLETVIYILH